VSPANKTTSAPTLITPASRQASQSPWGTMRGDRGQA
jgi:hypothetical protein